MSLRVCYNVYVPLRESPSHRAEMTSQLLFGERYGITDKIGNWLRVTTLFDSFTGWVDGSQVLSGEYDTKSKGIITGSEITCLRPDKSRVRLMPGSEIHSLDFTTGTFRCMDEEWILAEKPDREHLSPHENLADSAMQFINTPYLWGGRTPGGIDCSGLVQIVFKIHGIALPRNSSQQAECGTPIDFLEEALPGDLLFFSGEGDTISHVGILESRGLVLHASGSVRIDRVDHQGIWNETHGRYTHRLRIIRRIAL